MIRKSKYSRLALEHGAGAYDPHREGVWRAISKYLQQFILPTDTVLDLGAGYCSFINHIDAVEKHALDSYEGFKQFAKEGVSAHVGSCEDLTIFPADKFDTVFASNLLEHLTRESIDKMLSEVMRILKPRGRIVLLQPNFKYSYREYFDNYTHLTVFTEISLADLLVSKGFEIALIKPRLLPIKMKGSLPKWPWLVSLYLRFPFRPFAGQMLVIANKPALE